MPEPLFRKIDTFRLYVADLEAAVLFYEEQLGHTVLWRTSEAAGLSLSETDTEIVLQVERKGQEIEFLVPSADEAARRFEAAGGKVLVGPFDIQSGRCVVVQDPWGNELVLLDVDEDVLSNGESQEWIVDFE